MKEYLQGLGFVLPLDDMEPWIRGWDDWMGVFLWFCQPVFSVDFPSNSDADAGPARGLCFSMLTVRYAAYGTLSRMIA